MAQELTGAALAAALAKISPTGASAAQILASATPAKTVTTSNGTVNQVNANGTYSSGSNISSSTPTRRPASSFSSGDMSQEAIDARNAERTMYSSAATTSNSVRNDLATASANGTPISIPSTMNYANYMSQVSPYVNKPTTPNYVDKYTQLRRDQGIEALEDTIGANEAQKAELLANLDKFKRNEMSGQPLGFAQGRISTEQQGIQDQIDFIDRQENIAIAKLNTKNKFIENIMNMTKDDYTTANDAYNTEFNHNMAVQAAVSTEGNKIRDDARATLTTINNMVANSGRTYSELDLNMRAKVNELELQAGIPVGTFETFAASKPKANIISTSNGTDSSGNDFVYFISKDPITGELTTDKLYTGGVSSTGGESAADINRRRDNDIAEAIIRFQDTMKEKGWVGANPDEYKFYRDYIQSEYGYNAVLEFDKQLANSGISVDYINK